MTDQLHLDTVAFFLRGIIADLQEEVDIRGRGYRRFFLFQWALYLFALVRDIARIPLHDPRGIGQARFRGRVRYIQDYARPSLEYFLHHLPLADEEKQLLEQALDHLQRGEALIRDGAVPVFDEWYASMGEFFELQQECRQAGAALECLVGRMRVSDATAPPRRA